MPTDAEILKLIFQVEGRAELEQLKDSIKADEEALHALIGSMGQMSAAQLALNPQIQNASEHIIDMKNRAKELETALGRGTGGSGYAVLELSRGLEDLQYGIAGVLNNIPGFIAALGGSAGLAGAFSIAAVAAYQLYKHWDDLAGLFETRNPIPATTDSLKAAEAALKENSKALEEFKGKTSLSNDELARFNELTEQQSVLEAKLAEERKLRATVRRGLEAVPAEQQALAQANLAAQAGRGAEVQRAIQDELQRRAEADIAEAQATLPEAIAEATAGLRPGIDIGEITRRRVLLEQRQAEFERATRAGVGAEAQRLYAGFLTGQPGATADVMGILQGTGYLADVAKRAEELSPEGKERAKLDEQLTKQGEINERRGDEQARRQADQAKKGDDRLTEMLNRQGMEAERMGVERADRQEEQAKKEADRQEEQAKKEADRRSKEDARALEAGRQLTRSLQIRAATGWQMPAAQAQVAAKRSLELQSRGIDATVATQAAMEETQLATAQLIMRMQRLESNAMQLQTNGRRLRSHSRSALRSRVGDGG